MPVSRILRRGLNGALLGLLLLTGLGSATARAAPIAPEQFPLGQGKNAVCQAIRNDDAPGAQVRGARAWDVHCLGYSVTLGTLYAYGYHGGRQIAADGPWTKALAAEAVCDPAKPAQVKGVKDAAIRDCKALRTKVPYAAYTGSAHGRVAVAEGYVQIADVLETGLRVVAGVIPPPSATQVLTASSSASAAADSGSLAEVVQAVAPEKLREQGYSQNITWNFKEAEGKFQSLAQDPSNGAQTRAEAYLNWGLNASNIGNFDRAKDLFDEGDRLAGSDQALHALSLSYRAMDLRNQRRFAEAVQAAEAARGVFTGLLSAGRDAQASDSKQQGQSGEVNISPDIASGLRDRSSTFTTSGIDFTTRVRIQIAQVDKTEATSEAALGHAANAQRLLQDAFEILAHPALQGIATWLRAQVETEMAHQAEAAGHPDEARSLLLLALGQIRIHQAGTADEAYLLMDVARLDAGAGRRDQALIGFKSALSLFSETRGSLGSSSDDAGVYLDLLIEQSKADPAHAADYADRFMTAVQSLGRAATAQTVAQLSARLDQSDSAVAGLIRALEERRRDVRAKESAIAQAGLRSDYTPAARAADEAERKSLIDQARELEQQVAAADPKYGLLVATDVTLKDLQSALKPGELYLKVVLLSSRGYVLAVSSDRATPYRIDIGKAQGAQVVSSLRQPFEARNYLPSYNVAKSYALFTTLFGPVQDQVLKARHIIYNPDVSILSLPIAALATDQASVDLMAARLAKIRAKGEGVLSYDGVNWLGRTADMSLVVSATSFVQARKFPASRAQHAFLGFGDSVQPSADNPRAYESVINWGRAGNASLDLCTATRDALLKLKPLAAAIQELNAVGASIDPQDAQIVTGAAFNDVDIVNRKDFDQYRVVYFATHGLLPSANDCLPEPALLTSVGEGASDGLLTELKIWNMHLDADLVVLSACDTGGGSVVGRNDQTGLDGAGEALTGLTRAFINAGARSLIVSHWSVDSEATMRLMTGMFASHAATQAGALRDSALAMMASPDQYSHPYYWAAFTVVGDGARPMPVR